MNLKLKDIDAATEAKHRLEEKQRAEARERKEKEQQWETRVSISVFAFMAPVKLCGQTLTPKRMFHYVHHRTHGSNHLHFSQPCIPHVANRTKQALVQRRPRKEFARNHF